MNDNAELLCSKRSEGLSGNPGKWQTYFGGHVSAGMEFRETALRELREETGLHFNDEDLHLVHRGRDDANKKHFESYAIRFNGMPGDLAFTDGEVTETKWMSIDEYAADQSRHPDLWCNSCKPERQRTIRDWVSTFKT